MTTDHEAPLEGTTAREVRLQEAAERQVPPGYLSDIREFDREAERRRLGA